MDTPQKRLLAIIKARFKTKRAFATAIELDPANLTKYLKEGGGVLSTAKVHQKFLELGLNYNWYVSGEGQMFLVDAESKVVKIKLNHLNVPLETANLTSISSNLSESEYSVVVPEKAVGVYITNNKMYRSMPIGSYAIFERESEIKVGAVGLFKAEGVYFCRRIKLLVEDKIALVSDDNDFARYFNIEEIEFIGLLKMVILQ